VRQVGYIQDLYQHAGQQKEKSDTSNIALPTETFTKPIHTKDVVAFL
jgi:hypothetical protein